jgi:hypothetical protein
MSNFIKKNCLQYAQRSEILTANLHADINAVLRACAAKSLRNSYHANNPGIKFENKISVGAIYISFDKYRDVVLHVVSSAS